MSLGLNGFEKKLKKDLEENKVELKKDKYGIPHLIVKNMKTN